MSEQVVTDLKLQTECLPQPVQVEQADGNDLSILKTCKFSFKLNRIPEQFLMRLPTYYRVSKRGSC